MYYIRILCISFAILSMIACSSINEDINNDSNQINRLSYTPTETENNFTNDTKTKILLATYTSPILTNDKNRYHNIKIVRDRLNGYVLNQGETFSYNEVCGPYGKKDGFKKATIQVGKGKKEKDYGGGVCQLSSTLYNAVKDLDIKITERHHHSTPVNYVPKNDDATVSLKTNMDFKFVNESMYPILFESTSTEDELTVSVYALE